MYVGCWRYHDEKNTKSLATVYGVDTTTIYVSPTTLQELV